MSLETQREELARLGFRIVEQNEESIVATTRRFHWECMFTGVTYVVFVRRVEELTPSVIEADREALQARATALDPSALPRGLQKGVAVITAYVADRVSPEARALCEKKPKARFAFFYLPAALDRSTGLAHYLRSTPAWGAIYFSKFRFLIERTLATSKEAGAAWPISIGGAVLTVLVLGIFAVNLLAIFGRR